VTQRQFDRWDFSWAVVGFLVGVIVWGVTLLVKPVMRAATDSAPAPAASASHAPALDPWWKSKVWTEPTTGGEVGPERNVWLLCTTCLIRAESDSEIFTCVQIKNSTCRGIGYQPTPEATQNEKARLRFGSDTCSCGKDLTP
jgi:hypothetical protein